MDFTSQSIIQLIISALTLIGMLYAGYRIFNDPDIKADKEITVAQKNMDEFKTQCQLKHEFLNENLSAIRENHLKHLEADVMQIKIDITKIYTILEERLPRKTN